MPASLAFRLSGGAGNTAPLASTGGVMSSAAATANSLWDTVSAGEALAGDTEYRAVFLLNTGDKDLANVRLWISDQAASGTLALALDGAGKNADAEVVANESTAPTGETFSSPASLGTSIAVSDLAVGDRHAIWVRRVISAATSGVSLGSNAAELRVDFEFIP